MKRLRLLLAVVMVGLAVPGAARAATTLYVTPAGGSSGTCSTPATPCSLTFGVASASAGDTVEVAPGDYSPGAFILVPPGVTVEGTQAGAPPHITASNPGSHLLAVQNGDVLRNLWVNELASDAIAISGLGASHVTFEDLFVQSPHLAAVLLGDADLVRNSVFYSTGAEALELQGSPGDPTAHWAMALRGVTAICDTGRALNASAYHGSLAITVVNSILHSGGSTPPPVLAFQGPSGALSLSISYSNLVTPAVAGGATYVDGGHNQAAAPVFVDASHGDFHETASSPTLDAGLADPANGARDLDGHPRTLGPAPDIGAFELPEKPSGVTGDPVDVGPTSATLAGTVNPEGLPTTAQLSLGTTPGVYSRQLPATAPGAGNAAVPVSANFTQLAPSTVYYYRVEATNAAGTTVGAEQSFTTPPAPLALTHVSQSHSRWRVGSALPHIARARRAPVGTTFTFNVNQPVLVSFAFTQRIPGHHAGHHCRAGRGHGRPCALTIARGTLGYHVSAGTRHLNFQGRLSRHRRLGPGSYAVQLAVTDVRGESAVRRLRFAIVR